MDVVFNPLSNHIDSDIVEAYLLESYNDVIEDKLFYASEDVDTVLAESDDLINRVRKINKYLLILLGSITVILTAVEAVKIVKANKKEDEEIKSKKIKSDMEKNNASLIKALDTNHLSERDIDYVLDILTDLKKSVVDKRSDGKAVISELQTERKRRADLIKKYDNKSDEQIDKIFAGMDRQIQNKVNNFEKSVDADVKTFNSISDKIRHIILYSGNGKESQYEKYLSIMDGWNDIRSSR